MPCSIWNIFVNAIILLHGVYKILSIPLVASIISYSVNTSGNPLFHNFILPNLHYLIWTYLVCTLHNGAISLIMQQIKVYYQVLNIQWEATASLHPP